jgi:CRISPR-associated endonuclease/helicase Cas3
MISTEMCPQADLAPDDFGEFFREVHGHSPFPWQESLLERVLQQGWPDLIDVPTGLGKTAILDVAVFLSALGSEHARRRVFLVVDRRLIVDQAHEEARRIQRALGNAQPGTRCAVVGQRLAVRGDDSPYVLDVTRMRGGLSWSWLWLERPDRHALVTGTVDQIGSRFLFRGYGVGEHARSIDAALVGTDSLIIIDEAHLSDPFLTTLTDTRRLDNGLGREPLVIAMSASPDSPVGDVHRISAADESHPVARKRLRAAKSLHPVSVSSSAGNAAGAMAAALAHWARQLGGPGLVTGVIANTVGMARAVFEQIRDGGDDSVDCVLLTGRVRPVDREYLLNAWYPRIKSGALRESNAELYVVATQTIEAGADIDLDGLVMQAASLPATVQRLGRLNRLGDRATAQSVVLHAEKLTDPVYGTTSTATWSWLAELTPPLNHKKGSSAADLGKGAAVSPLVLRQHAGKLTTAQQQSMRGANLYVPVLSQSILDAWARTSPVPHPDVPVAPFLHGIASGEPTVSLIWRTDLLDDEPQGWARNAERIPPSTEEAIDLPISALRRWLAAPVVTSAKDAGPSAYQAEHDAGTSDLESQRSDEAIDAITVPGGEARHALRYRSNNKSELVTAKSVQPGDLLIVPAAWGGCDRYGWKPGSATPVTDVADFSGGGRRSAIRVGQPLLDTTSILAPDLIDQIANFISQVRIDVADGTVDNRAYRALLHETENKNNTDLPHRRVLRKLAAAGVLTVLDNNLEGTDSEDARTPPIVALFAAPDTGWNEDESSAGTSVSPSRKQISLLSHQRAVHRKAVEFATNLGLPQEITWAIALAALYHDEGKRDGRFQVMLHEGDRWRAEAALEPLAKSGMDPADQAALRRAARLSCYPAGMRHEAFSARITEIWLQREGEKLRGLDKDLVVHLVSAHHGRGRPLLPPVVDLEPVTISFPAQVDAVEFDFIATAKTVDWASPLRFDQLCERYGRWGLAFLESVVRLADIWCSSRSEECSDQDC